MIRSVACLLLLSCATEEIVVATREAPPPGTTSCQDSSTCSATEVCAKRACDAPGFCELRPTTCTDALLPVCGCDGVTYFNDCLRAAAGVARLKEGECGRESKLCGGPAGDCAVGESCAHLFPAGPDCHDPRGPGVCWGLPSRCGPPAAGGDFWHRCGGVPPGGPCVSLCDAIRSAEPHERARSCM
jgi:Kazal-type serine protease inhibitor domain